MMLPRIKGQVGQGEDGKYYFQVIVALIDGTPIGEPIGPFGPWETEAEAQKQLRLACQMACETIETKVDGKPSGKYIDLLNKGEVRRWDRKDEQ